MTGCWDRSDVNMDACDCDTGTLDADLVDVWADMAAGFLWRATGRQYGVCETTYRPCARDYCSGVTTPARLGGEWVNLVCGQHAGPCTCGTANELVLGNVEAVTGLKFDGHPHDVDDVLVYDRRYLVHSSGSWPLAQNLRLTDDSPGTWSITVEHGYPIPAGGEIVAGILACELTKSCVGSDTCRLPKRVETVTRQGVTMGFQDSFTGLDELRTGLWEVDAWIESVRSAKYRQPTVTSPDTQHSRELTWPTS